MKKGSAKRYFKQIHSYELITGRPYGERLQYLNDLMSTSPQLNLFTDYIEDTSVPYYDLNDIPEEYEETESKSILDELGEGLYGMAHPVSVWNQFHKRRVLTNLSSHNKDLSDANVYLQDISKVQEYINNINELKGLSERYNNSTSPEELRNLEELMREKAKIIREQNDYYKSEGKKSSMLVNLFFDPEKADMSVREAVRNAVSTKAELSGKEDLPDNPFEAAWYSIKTLPERLENLWEAGTHAANKVAPESFPSWLGGDDRGNYTRSYIMSTSAGDRSTDKWFKDWTEGGGTDVHRLQSKVDGYKDYWERKRREAEESVRFDTQQLQSGDWYFDPKDIDYKYQKLQENRSYGLLGFLNPANIPYSLAELGSSFGDIEHMGESMAIDAAIGWAAKKITTKFNPYTATASLVSDAASAANILKNIENVRKAQNFSRNVNFIGGALSTGSTLYFTNQMRRWETNAEAMDGYSNRVLNTAMNEGLDLNTILKNSNEYLNSIGVQTSGLDQIQQIQLALAFNSPTGDVRFEDLKSEARKGLSHLINSNNALAFMDYIEVLPFMNYTKSFLLGFGSRGFRTVKGRVPYSPNTLRRMGEENWIMQDPALMRAIDPTLRAEFDRQISRVAKKWLKNPSTQLKLIHGSKFLSKKASTLFPLMTKEGIEEGQQHLLQKRYERGEYDGDNSEESMFDLPSLVDTGTLAADAVASYIGINFGSPENGDEELQRAMEIGAITSMWFRLPNAVGNLMSDKTKDKLSNYLYDKSKGWIGGNRKHNSTSLRNLIDQFKNDKIIGKLVGENYGKLLDDEHVGLFFDSFSRSGVNRDRLEQSLQDFKLFKGPGVTDDFIDKDVDLLNTAWNMYNNDAVEDILKDLGVEKGSKQHRNFVQLAVRSIIDADTAGKIYREDADLYQQKKEKFINDALQMMNDYDDGLLGTVGAAVGNNQKLANLVKKLSDTFLEIEPYRAEIYNKYTSSEQSKKDAIDFLKKRGIRPEQEQEKQEIPYSIGDSFYGYGGKEFEITNIKDGVISFREAYSNSGVTERILLDEFSKSVNSGEFKMSKLTKPKSKQQNKNKQYSEKQISDAIKELADAKYGTTKEEFIREYLENIFSWHVLKTAEKVHKLFKNREELLYHIQKELGIDINYERLSGMIYELNESINGYKKHIDKIIKDSNDLMLGSGQQAQSELEIMSAYDFDMPDDFNSITYSLLINNALYKTLEPQAAAYIFGEVDPTNLRRTNKKPSWKQLTREQKDYYIEQYKKLKQEESKSLTPVEVTEDQVAAQYDKERRDYYDVINRLRDEYKKAVDKQKKNITADNIEEAGEDSRTIEDIKEEAARLYIEQELQTRIDRKKIAHKEYIKDKPLTYNDITAADEGNKEALDKVKSELGAQQEELAKPKPAPVQVAPPLEQKATDDNENININLEESAQEDVLRDDDHEEVDLDQGSDELIDDLDLDEDEILLEDPNVDKIFEETDDEKYLKSIYSFEDPDEKFKSKKKTKQDNQTQTEQDKKDLPEDENSDEDLGEDDDLGDDLGDDEDLDDEDLGENISETLDEFNDEGEIYNDDGWETDQENIPGKKDTTTNSTVVFSDYISETFFYQPYQKDRVTPNLDPPVLAVGKTKVKLLNDATLKSPYELSQKLLEKGWLEKTTKYYVLTADEGHIDLSNPDSLNIALILQDGKDAYAVFLRGLSIKYVDADRKVELQYGNRISQLRDRLRHMFDLPEYVGNSPEAKAARKKATLEGRRQAYKNHNPDVVNPSEKDINDWYTNTSWENKDDADDAARLIMSGNKPIHTERHIRNQINALRERRQEIIDACTVKDDDGNYILLTEGYKIVLPQEVRISNGKINTQIVKDLHTFRNLTEGGFEMSDDVEELSRQIDEGEVRMGIGVGRKAPEGQEYAIVHFDKNKQSEQDWDPHVGVGRSGKIYAIVKASNGNDVPIMLREERFDNGNPNMLPQDVTESIGLDNNIKNGEVPTIGEFIFRIITHTFNINLFGMEIPDNGVIDDLVTLLVHEGEDTIITDVETYRFQPYLIKKQLWFDSRGVLHISLPDKAGMYMQTKITRSQMFDPQFQDQYGHTAESNRKKIIAAISRNFHWNTWRETLPIKMDVAYPALMRYLKSQFAKNKDLKEITLFGIKELTFKRDDLFDDNLNYKNVSHMAWMLKSGKIVTDVGKTVFKAPFVFGYGTKAVSSAEETRFQAVIAASKLKGSDQTPSDTGGVSVDTIILNNVEQQERSASLGNVVKRIEDYDSRETGFTSDEFGQQIQKMISTPKEKAREILDAAELEDAALLDVPVWFNNQGELISLEQLHDNLKSAVDRYVLYYNKNHKTKIKAPQNLNDAIAQNYDPVMKSEQLPMILVYKDGTSDVVFMDSMQIYALGREDSMVVSGVYSSEKGGSGIVDANSARSWIQECLGLTEDLVIITNAVLKSVEDKKVFGVTQIAADVVNDETRVLFMFSKNAGHGIQFHEAFHYVNLLLHTKEERKKIYDHYRNFHMFRAGWSDKRIEEALAEKFRKYAQMRTDKGIVPSMKRLFNNILDFTFQYRKRTMMRQIYNAILNGKYKGKQLDKESIREFRKAYPRGAEKSMYIPKVKQRVIDNFKAITSYNDFYRISESLASSYIHYVLRQTVEDSVKSGENSFTRFLDDLKKKTIFNRSPYIQDILDNPVAFKYSILGVLRKYGIKGKTNSLKKYQNLVTQDKLSDDIEEREAEDRYENTWDIDKFELSVKDNVAFRAKLFLSQIPKGKFDEITRKWIPQIDDLLKTQSYYDFDEVHNLVIDNLSNFSTFEAIKREVERLSKASAFFYSMKVALDSIEGDLELENQLANAIKKQSPNLMFLESSRQKKKNYDDDDELDMSSEMDDDDDDYGSNAGEPEIFDYDKELKLSNDNTLKPLRALLRTWSQFAYSTGMFKYSENQKANIVSGGVYKVKLKYDELVSIFENHKEYKTDFKYKIKDQQYDIYISENGKAFIKRTSNKTGNDRVQYIDNLDDNVKDYVENMFRQLVDTASSKFLELVNMMGIPFDKNSLDFYIDGHINSRNYSDIFERYRALKLVIAGKENETGSLQFIINLLVNNSGEAQLSHPIFKSEPKPLYLIYEGYKLESEIGKMAKAYNMAHPSRTEHSVTVPGGKTMYPINENNSMSDIIRWLNENYEGRVDDLLKAPYTKHAVILKTLQDIKRNGRQQDLQFKLNLFVGMKDNVEQEGQDYFGITPLEDTVSKMMMIHDNMLVLPTMADKKTYYAISLDSRSNDNKSREQFFNLPHDVLTYKEKPNEDGSVVKKLFSLSTLNIFVGYFKDEIESLTLYYDRKNIEYLISHPSLLKENFHGKIENGRMDFSGNGGLFRYFYDILVVKDENGHSVNLNQLLEFAYKRQQLAEDDASGEGVGWIREEDKELDGFELVRRKLNEIRDMYFYKSGEAKAKLYLDINNLLFARIKDAMIEYSKKGSNQLLKDGGIRASDGEHVFIPKSIPRQLLNEYLKLFQSKGVKNYTSDPYNLDRYGDSSDLALSVIGNFVVGLMISIIEIEKIFSGDPAFYNYKYRDEYSNVVLDGVSIDTRILSEKDTDKIKRLGALLSPGSEIRTDYPKKITDKYPELLSKKYTVANISDANAVSIYLKELETSFGMQIVADYARRNKNKDWVRENISSIDDVYDSDFYENLITKIPKELWSEFQKSINQLLKPYKKINVSDAQVFIRPALYRKIRIGLGQWTFNKIPVKYRDVDGKYVTVMYSDEEAFKILEEDGTWLSDPEKFAKVKLFQAFPLKMTYFQNETKQFGKDFNNPIATPIYNKMAIFPVFKYAFRSITGRKIYKRMNKENNELDMIAFESAVKVGLDENRYSPYDEKTESLATLNDALNKDSSRHISIFDGGVKDNSGNNDTLAVEILSLDNLRMQLNTEAHTEIERSLGTQMFKIMFGNLVDSETYRNGKTGAQIRNEIMQCINALTVHGVRSIKKEFYMRDGDKVNDKAVRDFILNVLKNNGAGVTAEEIMERGNKAASLMSRSLIEQSTSSLVNKEVIDIKTNGGSAVLQSVFGFVSFDSNTVRTQQPWDDGYYTPADGRELSWNEKDGSMEVILSLNFFRGVVPKKYLNTPDRMRQWLIDNDIIKGLKTDGTWAKPKPFGVGYRIPTQGLSSTFAFTVADVLPQTAGDVIIVPREFTAQTGSDYDVDKLFLATKAFDKNGKLIEPGDIDDLVNASDGAILNRMLLLYIDIVTDPKCFSNARASIDTITGVIKSDVLPLLRTSETQYAPAMYELTPSFLSKRKQEFSVGKKGIAPFALNIPNLSLTQYAHLTMDYGKNEFKFGNLDEATCEDENGNITRISDWLSAMVNAHVDVAKDPYVFALNINDATYNHANFLIRAGKGKSTFLFLALESIKKYADAVTSSGGMYGSHIEYKQSPKSRYKILKDLKSEYSALLDKKFKETVFRDEKLKQKWNELIKKLKSGDLDWSQVFNTSVAEKALQNPKTLSGIFFQLFALKAFEKIDKYALALSSLVRVSKIDTKKFGNDPTLHLNFINSYNNFKYNGGGGVEWRLTTDPDAQKIQDDSDEKVGKVLYFDGNWTREYVENDTDRVFLFGDNTDDRLNTHHVPKSTQAVIRGLPNAIGIDTKKNRGTSKESYFTDEDFDVFKAQVDEAILKAIDSGKIIVLPSGGIGTGKAKLKEKAPKCYDYLQYKLEDLVRKLLPAPNINIKRAKQNATIKALDHYFKSTFLDIKLFSATGMVRDILKDQIYSATDIYKDIFTTIMAELFGHTSYEIEGRVVHGYKDVLDEDKVKAIGNAIENVIRTKMLFKYGTNFIDDQNREKDSYSWEQHEKDNDYTGSIDYTFGGDINEALRLIRRIFIGDESSESAYNRNDLFKNISSLIQKMKSDPTNEKYAGLVNSNGEIQNELLNYLRPTPKTEKHPIPRMLFAKSRINTTSEEKAVLSSSFYFLLNHPNVGVRMIARDIAIYAYYSTYDTLSQSSFFDLVPPEYRELYDGALSSGLTNIALQENELNSGDILDIVCRNNYFDNNIVPLYNLYNGANDYADKDYGEYRGDNVTDYVAGTSTPSVIITTKANSKYIKVLNNGTYHLYKKVMLYDVSEPLEHSEMTTWYGYVLTEKLGRHSGSTHLYEFLSDCDTHSMFDENKLPWEFNYKKVEAAFKDFEKQSLEKLNGKKVINRTSLANITSLEDVYENDMHKRVDENMTNTDALIIISDKDLKEFSSNSIDLSKPIEQITENLPKDNVSISFENYPEIHVEKSDIDDYVQELVSLKKGRLDPNLSHDQRELALKQYEAKVLEVAEDNIKQRMLENYILNILTEIEQSGVLIDSAYVSLEDPIQKAALKVLSETDFVDKNKLFVVSKNKIGSEEIENVVADDQLVLSEDENISAEAQAEFIDNSINAQKNLINRENESLDSHADDSNDAEYDDSDDIGVEDEDDDEIDLDSSSNLLSDFLDNFSIINDSTKTKDNNGC